MTLKGLLKTPSPLLSGSIRPLVPWANPIGPRASLGLTYWQGTRGWEMRGRFWVAAVAAASPILLFGAAIGTRGLAQETAATEDADDPNAGAPTPAEQSVKPDAMPPAAEPAAAAPAPEPADSANEPESSPPATTTVQ